MSNENYVNHYVEILTSTMTDAVIRNISLQANAKISENVIGEQQNKIEKLNSEIGIQGPIILLLSDSVDDYCDTCLVSIDSINATINCCICSHSTTH